MGKRTAIFLVALLLSVPAWADAPSETAVSSEEFLASRAADLFKAGDYEGAVREIEALLAQHSGDSLLERYRAMCLDRLGRSQEAVAIFEGLLAKDPAHVPTRYFLGQAHARLGNRDAAMREWQWVRDNGTGTPYEGWARTALARFGEGREVALPPDLKPWSVTSRYGYEYDSNVTLKPNDGSLAGARDESAGRQVMDLNLGYRARSRADGTVDLLYATRQSFHDDSLNEFNFHSEEFGLNARKRLRWGARDLVAGARYDFLMGFLDDDLFSVSNRWTLSADARLTPRSQTVLFDRFTLSGFGPDGSEPARTSRDGATNDVGVTHYVYAEDFRSYLYARQEFNSSHTRGTNFDAVGSTSRVGVHAPLKDRLHLDVSTGLDLGFYHNFSSVSSGDTSRRRDRVWDVYTALTYRLSERLALRGFYRFINGENQNNLFDYNRHLGGVALIASWEGRS